MDRREATVVVCGATGQQGTAVVERLLRGPLRVHALCRNPAGDGAGRCAALGATIVAGNLNDLESLKRAFAGASYVFGMTFPWSKGRQRSDPETEIAQGQNIALACESVGIEHLVMSTTVRLDEQRTQIPHVDSKIEIEACVRASSLSATVLGSSLFMENIGRGFLVVEPGKLTGVVDGDVKVGYMSTRDVAEAVAAVLAPGSRWRGRRINLIADWISGHEIAGLLERKYGRPFAYHRHPEELTRTQLPESHEMFRRIERLGRPPIPHVDARTRALAETLEMVPDRRTVERFVRETTFLPGGEHATS